MATTILDTLKKLGAATFDRLALLVGVVDDDPATYEDGDVKPARMHKTNRGIYVHLANAEDIAVGGGGGEVTQGTGSVDATGFWTVRLSNGTVYLPLPTDLGSNGGLKVEPASQLVGAYSVMRLSDGSSFYDALTDTQLRATPVPVSGTITTTPSGTQDVAAANQAASASFPFRMSYDGTNFVGSGVVNTSLALPAAVPYLGAYLFAKQRGASTGHSLVCNSAGALSVVGTPVATSIGSVDPVYVGVNGGSGLVGMLGDSAGRVQTVQTGLDANGTNRTASTTFGGSQVVSFDPSNLGPFGDLIACEPTPLVQRSFGLGVFVDQLDVTSVSGTGATVDINANRLRLQNGTSAAGSALYTSTMIAQYRAGQGFIFLFTAAFATGVTNSSQSVGFGTATNGVFVGFNGATFGVLHRNNGVDTWVTQSAWNGDKCNGTGASAFTIAPTSLNVFRVVCPFLGAGAIRFFVMHPNGTWLLAHTIQYPNSSTSLEFSDPAFRFRAQNVSTTSTTNLTSYVGSYAAFIVGRKSTRGAIRNIHNRKSVSTTETAIFTIKNATTVNGDVHNACLTINWMNGSNDGSNSDVRFRFLLNTTLGGTPSFTPVNGSTGDNGDTLTSAQSVLSVDTAGTTVTGGIELFVITMARNSTTTPVSTAIEDFQLGPGQTFTVTATAFSGTQDCGFTINGRED